MSDIHTDDGSENVVVVVGDEGAGGAGAGGGADTGAANGGGDHGFDDLKRQLADEQAGRERDRQALAQAQRDRSAAQREAQESRGKATEFEATAFSAQYDSVVNALGLAQQEADKLASEQEAAMSDGDFKKATELNVKIGRQMARVVQLEDGKAALDVQRQARAAEPPTKAAPQQAQRTENEQREAYLATQRPKTAAWMRAHPAYFDDIPLQQKVIGGHYLAVEQGLVPESDDYFKFVEEHAGLRQKPAAQQSSAAVVTERPGADAPERSYEAPPQGRQPMQEQRREPRQEAQQGRVASAAPSREVQSAPQNGRNATKVSISQAEREHALATALEGDNDPVGTFAKHKLQLMKEGKWYGA